MLKQLGWIIVLLTAQLATAQGGQGGAQGSQGGRQAEYDRQVNAIESAIRVYLNGDELKSILTPGEHVEWRLDLKVGQVVVAEARSDAFDPALEITQGESKVLASNDDRYPGDQRPLLLWECPKDGEYFLRARSFMNKAGGQCFARFNVYDTMPLEGSQSEERAFDKPVGHLILFKVPMKAGQIKRIMVERPTPRHFGATMRQVISPIGLPDANLAGPLHAVTGDPAAHGRGPNALMAPVSGNYYILADLWGAERGQLRASARELTPTALPSGSASDQAQTDTPTVWTYRAKAGEFLRVALQGVHLHAVLIVAEAPDVSKYSLDKPETNPFFPRLRTAEPEPGPAFANLPARARDPRVVNLVAQRDATIWIASNGAGPDKGQYTLTVQPAARALSDAPSSGKLVVGGTDYWAFEAKVGDVISLTAGTETFAQNLTLRGPSLDTLWNLQASPDQATLDGLLVVTKPGRYLAGMTSRGGGGGGAYTISRKVYSAKGFAKGKPASGQIGEGEVQVWKFTVQPNDPLLIRWRSSSWAYGISVYQEDGQRASLPLTEIDSQLRVGILKVSEPTTFLILLTGKRTRADYTIDVLDLPGTS